MLTSTMMLIPGTKIYVFMGIFNNLPNCEDIPVIKHFENVLSENDLEDLVVIFHMSTTGINNKVLKIGFYKRKDDNSGEQGAGNSTDPGTIDMTPIIKMQKRA